MKAAFNPIPEIRPRQQCVLNGPSLPQPPSHQRLVESVNLGPLRNALARSLKLNKHVAFCISLLRLDIRPSAVFREITSVAVDAVNRAAIWTLTHVVQKVLKDHPSVAYGYPNCSVTRVFVMAWVGAASDHVHPGVVRRGGRSPQCMAVREPVVSTPASDAAIDAAPQSAWTDSGFKRRPADRASSGFFHVKILPQNSFLGQEKPLPGLTKRRQSDFSTCTGG